MNGKAGFLVKRNDHVSLSKKIKLFLENPEAFKTIVKKAQAALN